MIEVSEEDLPTLKTLEELFQTLSLLIGRTIMLCHSISKVSSYSYVQSIRTVGKLEWLKVHEFDGQLTEITISMGKPQVGDRLSLPTVSLNDQISVLSDGVWRTIHAPKSVD